MRYIIPLPRCPYLITCCATVGPIEPLSRRLDRCDHAIQNESGDSNGGSVEYVAMQVTLVTVNSGMLNAICIVTYHTLPPLESLDSF